MVFLAQEPKSASLLDLFYHSTSFAFHLPAMSMEAKTSLLPVESSWEEDQKREGGENLEGRSRKRKRGFGGPQQGMEDMGTMWGRQSLQALLRWGDAEPFPAPILSEEEQQRSGRDGAFSHPSLVS